MGTPIRHGATGVFIPITEHLVTTLGKVVHLGCLALPEIPVEFRRHGLAGEGTFTPPGRQIDHDFFEFADAAGVDQLAGQAEAFVAALLRSSLQDRLVATHRFDHMLAFVDGQS